MKPFNVILSFLLFICMSVNALAQANLLNARVPQEIGFLNEQQEEANDEAPLEYGYIDDRDILWSKTVWELIDLNERINFPYYYPTDTLRLGVERRSLFHVLIKALRKGEIKEVYKDDYFKEKMTYEEVKEALTFEDRTEYELQLQNGTENPEQFIDLFNITAEEIEQYRIKGTWYFDKRLGEMKYRLLAIAPVAKQLGFDGPEEDTPLLSLFWIWYPDARIALNDAKVFNIRNSSQPITYDHMLNTRRFSSTIYKEENVYQDRNINQYIKKDALQKLLEAERIKNTIRDFEQDMWNN